MRAVVLTEKDKGRYEKWLEQDAFADIHQTWDWGVFQSAAPERGEFFVVAVERSGVYEDEKGFGDILASALVVKQKLPFNKCWFFIPHGPVVDYARFGDGEEREVFNVLFRKIEGEARARGGVFLRFEPPITSDYPNVFKGLHARAAHAHYQPESTLIVDIQHPDEELLKLMKPKGRYNIKVAQKHDVTIRISDGDEKDVSAFYQLFSETTERDKFAGHSKKYYSDILRILGNDRAKLYIAEYAGRAVAAAVITYYKNTATYYFGASSAEHRNVMAPYLLHWQAITDAKKAGFHYYDFFGISPEGSQNHPWAKVTEFKLKFGGDRINYYPAQEIVYSPFWYLAIRLAKKVLGMIRRG